MCCISCMAFIPCELSTCHITTCTWVAWRQCRRCMCCMAFLACELSTCHILHQVHQVHMQQEHIPATGSVRPATPLTMLQIGCESRCQCFIAATRLLRVQWALVSPLQCVPAIHGRDGRLAAAFVEMLITYLLPRDPGMRAKKTLKQRLNHYRPSKVRQREGTHSDAL